MARARTVQVPANIRDEITEVAKKAQRSIAFVAHRALIAGKDARGEVAGAMAPLVLATDDEDPADLGRKLDAALQNNSLAAAWVASREKFLAWVAKLDAAQAAERADDLDAALRDAQHPATKAARLAELAKNEYPRVRALVAQNPSTPPEVKAQLARDRDRAVREAAA